MNKNFSKTVKSYKDSHKSSQFQKGHANQQSQTSIKSPSANLKSESSMNFSMAESEVSLRQSKIKEQFFSKSEVSNIKIEDSITEEQNLYEDYKEMESQYNKQLIKLKKEIEKLKENCENEERKIKEYDRSIIEKRRKLTILKQVLDNSTRTSFSTQPEDFTQKISIYEEEFLVKKQQHEQKIGEVLAEREEINQQNVKMNIKIVELEEQLRILSQTFEEETYEENLHLLVESEQKIKEEIQYLCSRKQIIDKNIEIIRSQNQPITQEVHRKYLELFEKIYILQQVDKAQEIMVEKEKEVKKLEEYERKKNELKERKVRINQRQMRVYAKNKRIDQLSQVIKEKSTTLLNLYQVNNKR